LPVPPNNKNNEVFRSTGNQIGAVVVFWRFEQGVSAFMQHKIEGDAK